MGNYGQYSLIFNKKELPNIQQEFKFMSEINLNNTILDKNESFTYNNNLPEIIAKLENNKSYLNFNIGLEFKLDNKILLYHLTNFITELLDKEELKEKETKALYPLYLETLYLDTASFEEVLAFFEKINANLIYYLAQLKQDTKPYFLAYWQNIITAVEHNNSIIYVEAFVRSYQDLIDISLIAWGSSERTLFEDSLAIKERFLSLLEENKGLLGYFSTELSNFYRVFYLQGKHLDILNSDNWLSKDLLDNVDEFEHFIIEVKNGKFSL